MKLKDLEEITALKEIDTLHKIINSYDTRYFTLEEMQKVRRDFKLNGIYNGG
ncbi:MAG: hypothetical protein COA39_003765 [Sulfurimonas sp.]|nr:hypothetical protein [Sulfurimonas sp.]